MKKIKPLDARDQVALAALKAMIQSPPLCDRTKVDKVKWAQISYQWADAFLMARGKD